MEKRVYKLFGNRVKELRENRKITQEELANRVSLSRASITNIESGRQRVLLHQMVDIAKALNANPSQLVEAREEKAADKLAGREDVLKVIDTIKSEQASGS